MCLRGHCSSNYSPSTSILIWPTPRVAWSLVALFDCWYFQLSSTLTPSTGDRGKGSPSSPGKKARSNFLGHFQAILHSWEYPIQSICKFPVADEFQSKSQNTSGHQDQSLIAQL